MRIGTFFLFSGKQQRFFEMDMNYEYDSSTGDGNYTLTYRRDPIPAAYPERSVHCFYLSSKDPI